MAKTAAVYLTGLDLTRLKNAANRAGSNSPPAGLVDDLIARANMMPDNKIPAGVVTMNLVVYVVDDTGVEQEWTLVYPEKADVASAKLSALSPIGAILLGARTDKSAKCSTPSGAHRSLRTDRVAFQPKATDQHTL